MRTDVPCGDTALECRSISDGRKDKSMAELSIAAAIDSHELRSHASEQRRCDRRPLRVERAARRRTTGAVIPITGVAGIAFLAMQVGVDPRAVRAVDVL